MYRLDMNNTVKEELTHISKDGNAQNELRMLYNIRRRKDLKLNNTKDETLIYCIRRLKSDYPNWEPRYDSDFFRLSSGILYQS